MSKKIKVIYVEVKQDVYTKLERLCKKLDLPKTKVITKAVNLLDSAENPVKK